MKKKLTVLGILFLSISLLLAAEENQSKKSFSFIIKGGWGTAQIGDINAYYKTFCADEIFNIPENEGNKVPQLSSGFASVEVEGQYALSDHFSLGLALGSPIIKSDKAIWHINFNGSIQPMVLEPKVTVYVPIKINLYYRLPLSTRWQWLIGGGAGVYLTQISSPFNVFSHFPFGLQAVSGMEINLSRVLSLIVDGEWRLAKITDFKGSDPITGENGTLWYYKAAQMGSDVWQEEWKISRTRPESDPLGEWVYKDQRKAIFNLSGVSIRAGLKFRL